MFVSERMVQRFLIFPRWFADRLECARYAHVPLCNLGSDALTTIIDVLFARQLQHNRHLLWASEGPLPDIGGAEADQFAAWSDALGEEQINNPGAYRGVCVELDLYSLDVCAIMSSGLLDAQGITSLAVSSSGRDGGAAADDNGDGLGAATYTSAAFSDSSCARAFNLLKSLVTKWVDDVRISGDVISDSILTALYRYLCGFGDGLLYDPALHRVVYNLMSKLYKRLIGELRRLGAQVVYADFRRVVLSTGKHDLRAASEYTQFLLSALAEREVFGTMEVMPLAMEIL
jgi:DNA polymerase epsilon subunit 1